MNSVRILVLGACVAVARAADECPDDAADRTWPSVRVQTSNGVVEGVRVDVGQLALHLDTSLPASADVFRGIPYAQDTSGPKRFTLAEEAQAWTGTLDASKYGEKCPQRKENNSTASEDCLSLNVFTSEATSAQRQPVMVWIHGGGLRSGSPSDLCPWGIIYNLVRRGVVVVTIQYRLGLLGFFTTLTPEFPANLGLRDQLLAMQWVQREIGSFGGDPARVTLFGTSAGAISIGLHTYSPLSRGLFSQAYMGSGSGLVPFLVDGTDYYHEPSKVSAMKLCRVSAEQWAAMTSDVVDKLKACLIELPWQVIVNKARGSEISAGWSVWPAAIDGVGGFLPDFPAKLASTRDNAMPIILGTVPDEIATKTIQQYLAQPQVLEYIGESTYIDVLENVVARTEEYGERTNIVRAVINEHFRPNGGQPQVDDHVGWLKLLQDMATAKIYHGPAVMDAQLHLDNGNPNVRLFSFEHSSSALHRLYPEGYEAVLHSENKYYESSLSSIRNIAEHGDEDFPIIDKMGTLLTNFAKFGDPTAGASGTDEWQPISTSKPSQYYSVSKQSRMKAALWEENVRLFNEHVPAVAEGSGVTPTLIWRPQSGLTHRLFNVLLGSDWE